MAARLRIALVITELEMGGAERCLVQLACGLPHDRFAVEVYSLAPRPPAPRDALALRLEEAPVGVHYLGFARQRQFPAAVRALRAGLRRQDPHVIQSMLFHANVVSAWVHGSQRSAALSLGVRVADPSRWRQTIEGRFARRADRVVCVSESVAEYAARHMRVAPDRLTVIPNGVDLDACETSGLHDLARLGLPPGRRALTCISRLTRQKGVDLLVRAAPDLLAALPEHDLLIVGHGADAEALKHLARQCGVAQRVHFAGWQPHVQGILLASDLLLLPSRWEGMPNVLLEAMACGRPVVCTAVEGVCEVLGPLAELQTVPANDTEMLVSKVLSIVNHPLLAAQLGAQNRQRVVDHFALDRVLQKYVSLFESLSATVSPTG